MRRLELLIDTARKLSQNTRYDSDSGVPQDVFVQYFNNAQDSLTKQVVNLKTKFLNKKTQVSIVNGQVAYDYPDDCYMQHIDTVQWSDVAANPTYFTTLFKSYVKELVSTQVGYAFSYIPYNDGIHLNPPLSSGALTITYARQPERLGNRAGKITVCTQSSGQLTALTIDNSEASFNPTEANLQNYLCVVSRDGVLKARNIEYTSVNATSGVFTLSAFTLASTDVIAVGDYIVIGKNSCNLPDWPDACEGYLLKHAVYEAKYGDSSAWSKEARDDMAMAFNQLSESFSTLSDDISEIPITNTDYLSLV